MLEVRRDVKQKVVVGAAIAVLLGGGAFAAVSATGQGNGHGRSHARHALHRLHRQDLLAAADYLGISAGQLERELRSSGSLAKVAEAHAGKSAQGLIDAVVAARRARLAKASARLPGRVGAEIDGSATPPGSASRGGRARRLGLRGAGALALFIGGGRLAIAATDYLAVTPARLRGELRSGKTLAQIARATPGKSSAGLLRALLAARRQRLAHGLATGKVTAPRAARRQSRLQRRMKKLIQRKFVRGAKS